MHTPASILIVDDDSQNRRLVEILLRPEGYVTRTSGGGKHALASITEDPPDLILLDYLMPGIDGLKVASSVKADVATRNIPIIMLTALDHSEARLAAFEAGVEEFLTKPVDRVELWLRVRNLLRLKELSDLVENSRAALEQEVHAVASELQARTAELERCRAAMDEGTMGSSS